MKKVLRVLTGILFFILLLAPIGGIYMLTNMELEQYEEVYVPAVVKKSYGTPLPVQRRDMPEFITLSGSFVSTEQSYMELPELKGAYAARLSVSTGDYIEEGDLLGYTENGKTEICATATGVITDIHLGPTSYLALESPDKLALRCSVNEKLLVVLKRSGLKLTDTEGKPVSVLEIGKLVDAEGNIPVLLTGLNGRYGQKLTDLRLYTGKVYTNALTVDNSCLFQQPGSDRTWYVRLVTEEGNVLEIQEVQAGFSDGNYTCVTGLEENAYLDSGYAAVIGGG